MLEGPRVELGITAHTDSMRLAKRDVLPPLDVKGCQRQCIGMTEVLCRCGIGIRVSLVRYTIPILAGFAIRSSLHSFLLGQLPDLESDSG